MYRDTRFGTLMKGLSRRQFEREVDRLGTDKHSKGFRSWDQLLAMVYAQLSGCQSLRELEVGFNAQAMHHYHLGSREIKRSTLSDANNKRTHELYANLCNQLFQQLRRRVRKELKALLYLLDSTAIPLKGLGYDDWAAEHKNDRTQGLKVHIQLCESGATPVGQWITAPNVNDIAVGREIEVEAGATYVFDKGYCDYNWWYRLHCAGAFYVTRFKHNAGVKVLHERALRSEEVGEIEGDAEVVFKNRRPGGGRINAYHGTSLRRVVVKHPETGKRLVLATNDFDRTAGEIAALYKKRWGIELFFKWLKQNLKIKKFLGRSENAVKIQIYTALIAYVLVHVYRLRHGIQASLKMCLAGLKTGLFQRPALDAEIAQRRRRERQRKLEIQGVLAL